MHSLSCLRVRFWPVAALWSGICREFARSANSLRVLLASAWTFCPTGPVEFSVVSIELFVELSHDHR
jgi:hypothetical protein